MILNTEDLNLKGPFHSTFTDNKTMINECHKLVPQICSGSKKLHEIVEDLGQFITSKDVALRKHAIDLLSWLLTLLPKNFLNDVETQFIVKFLCGRLSDHHTILRSALRGILGIAINNLPDDIPRYILNTLFESVQCQAQPFDTRRFIYKIFEIILQNNADNVKDMGNELVIGITNAVSGEQDSKNLIIIFGMWPRLMKIFQPISLSEEVFDTIACYFPIDYNSASSASSIITRDDLAEALIPCINSVPDCAKYCLPLISEKLNSDLKSAKLDSMRLLADGAMHYNSQDLNDHFKELWVNLKQEIMSGTDPEISCAASKTIVILLRTLSTTNRSFCEQLISQTITDTKWIIVSEFSNKYICVQNLLTCFAEVNYESCVLVLNGFVPLFMGHYCTEISVSNKRILLKCLNHFLTLSRKWNIKITEIPELSWVHILSFLFNELRVKDLDITLKQNVLTCLAVQCDILTNDQRLETIEAIYTEIDLGNPDMKETCANCLKLLVQSDSIFSMIEDRLHFENLELRVAKQRLDAIFPILKIKEIGPKLLSSIINIASKSDNELGIAALTCIKNLLLSQNVQFDVSEYLNEHVIRQLLLSDPKSHDKMQLVSNICYLIVKKLDTADQQLIFEKSNGIIREYTFVRDDGILFVDGLYNALRPNVKIDVDEILHRLSKLSLESNIATVRMTACKLICSLVNKMPNVTFFKATQEVVDNLLRSDANLDNKMPAIYLYVWLTKGFVTRNSTDYHCLEDFTNLLNDEDIGQFVAKEFKTLIRNDLNISNVAVLYVQRIFEYVIKKSKNVGVNRENYLTVIGGIVKELPSEIMVLYIEDIVPLLNEALLLKKTDTILEYLTALQVLLERHIQIFSQTADFLIPIILDMSMHKDMRTRSAALHCLISFSKYPAEIIGAFKEDVLLKLNDTIDDRKRLIRKLAVVTRTHWYLVNYVKEK